VAGAQVVGEFGTQGTLDERTGELREKSALTHDGLRRMAMLSDGRIQRCDVDIPPRKRRRDRADFAFSHDV
jgi:hypothetical protein